MTKSLMVVLLLAVSGFAFAGPVEDLGDEGVREVLVVPASFTSQKKTVTTEATVSPMNGVEVLEYLQTLSVKGQSDLFTLVKPNRLFHEITGDSAVTILNDQSLPKSELDELDGFRHYSVGPFHCVVVTYILGSDEVICQVSVLNNGETQHEDFCRPPICSQGQ